ncbi:MAG: hypothetical protein RLZZ367_1428 [Bacteroidota bacterium]|jgi:predicted lipoprotein
MKHKYRNQSLIFFAAVILLVSIQACKPKPSALENYNRTTLLTNLADSVIAPAYNNLSSNAALLNNAANAFAAAPTTLNLQALQTAWSNALDSWMSCEMFNLGYAETNSLDVQIGAVPANYDLIETEIHGTNTLDESYIAATGTTRKGFAAIEYLIYGDGITQQAVLDSFTTSTAATRRLQYLQAICAHIKTQASAVSSEWNNGPGYNNFISQTQLDISGSLNLLVNALTEHIELVRKAKVGKPLGIDNGGTTDGSLCEYRLAPRSIQNIRTNILAWKDIYTGKSGIGADDYLDHVGAQYNGQPLSNTISQQLDVCLEKANAINAPLHSAVTVQQAEVNALYLELKKLTVLVKVDLASNLGVIITFSDNDGD